MSIRIIEVGPRDGLQNEKAEIPTDVKLRFVANLLATGLTEIEATSFVSPKWVPHLGDAAELWPQLPIGGRYSALVPNKRGLDRALELGVERIAVFTAASESFVQKNVNMSIRESLDGFAELVGRFREDNPNGWVRGYVSTIFECPYEGRIEPKLVMEVARQLLALGVDEISLGDTIGTGSVREVRELAKAVVAEFDPNRVAWHFHDTYGMAIGNLSAALDCGFTAFDASVSGLGGCPYAMGASGNLATEDLVYFLERNGVSTGIDLKALARASLEVLQHLDRLPQSKAQVALLARDPSA